MELDDGSKTKEPTKTIHAYRLQSYADRNLVWCSCTSGTPTNAHEEHPNINARKRLQSEHLVPPVRNSTVDEWQTRTPGNVSARKIVLHGLLDELFIVYPTAIRRSFSVLLRSYLRQSDSQRKWWERISVGRITRSVIGYWKFLAT